MGMVSLEVLLLALARCPTSLCTSLCRARTGESPSQRPSDPLLLLLLTTLAPPMVLLAMALLEELPMELVSDTVLSEEFPMELLPTVLLVTVSAMVLLEELPTELPLEECSTDTLATTELPSLTLPSPVEYLEISKTTSRHQENHDWPQTSKIRFKSNIYFYLLK